MRSPLQRCAMPLTPVRLGGTGGTVGGVAQVVQEKPRAARTSMDPGRRSALQLATGACRQRMCDALFFLGRCDAGLGIIYRT